MNLGGLIGAVIQVFVFLVIARALGSFFIRDWSTGLPRFLWDVTEPVLSPVRRIIPPVSGIDFSPLIVIIGLQFINSLVVRSLP